MLVPLDSWVLEGLFIVGGGAKTWLMRDQGLVGAQTKNVTQSAFSCHIRTVRHIAQGLFKWRL